jgi:hypothetical protein
MSDTEGATESKSPPVDHKQAPETAWGAGRKAFVTTLVAILLNPVSAGVGYYMNHYLQRPSLEITYVSSSVDVENSTFPKGVWDALQKNQTLVTQIREGLTKLLQNPSESPCLDWLDKQDSWLDQCTPLVNRWLRGYQKASQAELAAVETNLDILARNQKVATEGLVPMQNFHLDSISLQLRVNRPLALANLRSFAKTLKSNLKLQNLLLSTLEEMGKTSTPRTGVVRFTVGVLNSGDRDGVVSNRANLIFDGGKAWLATDKYTAIKAHSFEEIELSVGGDDDQGKSQETLKRIVVSGEELKFEMDLDGLPKRIKGVGKLWKAA